MINLIPPPAKKAMIREYWLRVCVVWSVFVICLMIVGALLTLPSFVLVETQLRAFEQRLAVASEAAAEQDELEKTIKEANTDVTIVATFSQVEPIMPYFDTVLALRGEGIVVTTLGVQRNPEGSIATLTVSGAAATRESLTSFRTRLLAEPNFVDTKIPLESLADNEDIPFSLSIDVAPSAGS